jgi:hypothetical protein
VVKIFTGVALMIDRLVELEFPPPGAGLKTLICAVPAEARLATGTVAVSWVELLKLVIREAPFHCTADAEMKFIPLTIKENGSWPATAEVGLIDVTTGVGFWTLKDTAFDVPPPGVGVMTTTEKVPTVEMSLEPMVALNWELLTNEVVLFEPFH